MGDVVRVGVATDMPVTISGSPFLKIRVGKEFVQATFDAEASSPTQLVFSYTITALNSSDSNGVSIPSNPFVLNGASILDSNDLSLVSLRTRAVRDNSDNKVDVTQPVVTKIDVSAVGGQKGLLSVGDVVTVTVRTSENVYVNWVEGKPYISLNVGGVSVNAEFVAGSGTKSLSFSFTVTEGMNDLNGLSIDANKIALPDAGASIRDISGNALNLSHAVVRDNPKLKIDTEDPAVSNVSISANKTSLTLTSSEASKLYLVNQSVNAVSESSITSQNGNLWNSANLRADKSGSVKTTGLVDGIYRAYVVDAAGNFTLVGVYNVTGRLIENAIAPPTVSAIDISSQDVTNGYLTAGDVVKVTVTMTDDVVVNGSPTFSLKIGADNVTAQFVAANSSGKTLTFEYTVVSNQLSSGDGIIVPANALNLSGATIKDATGVVNANLANTQFIDSDHLVVDSLPPAVALDGVLLSSSGESNGFISKSDVVTVTVTLNELVQINGNLDELGKPTLELKIGNASVYATYDGIIDSNGKSQLTFTYQVPNNLSLTDSDGLAVINNSLVLPAGVTITDLAGNPANLSFANVALGSKVDTVEAAAKSIILDDASAVIKGYAPGNKLKIEFDEPVKVANLSLSDFSLSDVAASFGSGATLTALNISNGYASRFEITLGSGVNLQPGLTISLAAGDVEDLAGNANSASLSFTIPEGLSSDIVVPTVVGVEFTSADGSINGQLSEGDVLAITVSMSEEVVVNGIPRLALKIGTSTVYADLVDSDGSSLYFEYVIAEGDNGLSVIVDSLELPSGASISDLVGNVADLSLGAEVLPDSSYVVDTLNPDIVMVTAGSNDGLLAKDELISISVKYSENVNVVEGTPELHLDNGGVATYISGSGTDTLVFAYSPRSGEDAASIKVSYVTGSIQDNAGNLLDLSSGIDVSFSSGSFAVETIAPEIFAMSVLRKGDDGNPLANPKITLSFTEELDPDNLPDTSAFKVLTVIGGSPTQNDVSLIEVNPDDPSQLILTLSQPFQAGKVDVTFSDVSSANDADTLQDLAGNDVSSFFSGQVIDGYIRGAKIYIDTGSGTLYDTGVLTNAQGNFFLPANIPVGTLVIIGGFNIDTGMPNTTEMRAPAGSTTVNPLTTLVQSILASGSATDATDASNLVAQSLGIAPGTDLTKFDPMAVLLEDPNDPAALAAQKAAAQVIAISVLAASGDADASAGVMANLANTIVSSAGQSVNFSDASVLGAALNGVNLSLEAASNLADAVTAIATSPSLSSLTSAQSQFLDKTPPAWDTANNKPVVIVNAETNQSKPEVKINLNTSATDGSAAVIGDTVVLLVDGVQLASFIVRAQDLAQGFITLKPDSELSQGAHNLSAKIIDQAGNASDVSPSANVTIDFIAPEALLESALIKNTASVTLQSSEVGTAYLVKDNITVAKLSDITTQPNNVWNSVSISSAYTDTLLSANGLIDGQYKVYVVDAAGNLSSASAKTIVVDSTPPAATASIDSILDSAGADYINNQSSSPLNTFKLSGSISGAIGSDFVVVYDEVAGVLTKLGTAVIENGNWSFNTLGLSNTTHKFTVRVEDAAGNVSPQFSASKQVIVDADSPTTVASFDQATLITNDSSPEISGKLSASLKGSERVDIFAGSVKIGTAEVVGDTWSLKNFSHDLPVGTTTLNAVVVTDSGNKGPSSLSPLSVTVDTDEPILSISSNAVGVVASPVTYTFAFNEKVKNFDASMIEVVGGNKGTFTAISDRVFSLVVTPDSNSTSPIQVTVASGVVEDLAGNKASATTIATQVDTLAPLAPELNVISGGAISAAERSEGVVISGKAEANATVKLSLFDGVTAVGTPKIISVDVNGNWTYTLTSGDFRALGQGAKSIEVSAIDSIGNVSSVTTQTFSIDTTAPALTTFSLAADSLTGSGLLSGSITKDATPTITFQAEAGVTVQVSTVVDGKTVTGIAVESPVGSGRYEYTTSTALNDGTYTFTLSAIDAAGNSTVRSGSITIDTTAPVLTAPGVTSVAENSAVLFNASQFVDNPAGLVWTVGGKDADLLTISARGLVSLKSGAVLDFESGKTNYEFTVRAVDFAGNEPKDPQGNQISSIPVTVNVTNIDEIAPVIQSGSTGVTDENVSVIYTIRADDTDFSPSSKIINYQLTGRDAGLLEVSSQGVVSLKSGLTDFETKTTYQFSVVASDPTGNKSQALDVSVSVLNKDEIPPKITSVSESTPYEVQTVLYRASAIDTDFNAPNTSNSIVYSVTGKDASLLQIDPNTGVVTIKSGVLDFEAKSNYQFTLVARDAVGNQSTKEIVVVVQNVDEVAPTFTSAGNASSLENQNILYQATASDTDFNSPNTANSITYSLSGSDAALLKIDANGVVTLANGNLDFEAKSSYVFTVIATDAANNVSQKDVNVAIRNIDEVAPTIDSAGLGQATENQPLLYKATAVDTDFNAPNNANSFIYSLSGADAGLLNIDAAGNVTLRTGFINYEAKTSYNFNVVATDAAGNIATKAVTVAINNQDEVAPTFTSPVGLAVDQGSKSIYTAEAIDTDFAPLNNGLVTYSLAGTDAELLEINSSTGQVSLKGTGVAGDGAKKFYQFNVVATDASDNQSTQNVTVVVKNANGLDDPPIYAAPTTLSVPENQPAGSVIYQALAIDPNGNNVSYSLSGPDSSLLVIDANTGEVRLANINSSLNFEAKSSYNFIVKANDGISEIAQSITLNVSDINEAPVPSSVKVTVTEDIVLTGKVSAVDPDANASLKFDLAPNQDVVPGFVLNSDGSYIFDASNDAYQSLKAGEVKTITVNYTVTDNFLSANGSLTIDITGTNDRPKVSTPVVLNPINEDSQSIIITTAQLLANASDADTPIANLTVTDIIISDGLGSIINNNDGTWSFTPANNDDTAVTFAYTIRDNVGGTTETTASIDIRSINDAPTSSGTAILSSIIEDQPFARVITSEELLSNISDIENPNGPFTISNVTLVGNGALVNNFDGTWKYTPTSNDDGSITLNFTVTDAGGASVNASAYMDIISENDAPTLTASKKILDAGEEDKAYIVTKADLLQGYTDVDNPTLTVTNLLASNATVEDNFDGSYTITPRANFNGEVKLTYGVSDGLITTPATQTIQIAAVNDAPVSSGPVTLTPISEDSFTRVITSEQLLANITDIDSKTLTVSSVSISVGSGSISNNNNGSWTYRPAKDDDTSVVFKVLVSDGNGGTLETTATLDITPVNDAPALTAELATLPLGSEGVAYTIKATDLLKGYTDAENNVLSVLELKSNIGSIVDNLDGTFTLTIADKDFNGTVSLSYKVSDGVLSVEAQSQTVTIQAVNDAPVVTGPVTLVSTSEDSARVITQSELLKNVTDIDSPSSGFSVTNLKIASGSGQISQNLVNGQWDGTWTFVPDANDDLGVIFSYTVNDGNGGSVNATATLDILPVNDEPIKDGSLANLSNGTEGFSYLVKTADLLQGYSDPEGSLLSVTNLKASNALVVDNLDGTFTLNLLDQNFNGEVTLTYDITDGEFFISATPQVINIQSVNDAPTTDQSVTILSEINEDTSVLITQASLLVNVRDVDSTQLTITHLSIQSGNGQLEKVLDDNGEWTGDWLYTPAADDDTNVTFAFTAKDELGASVSSTAILDISAINDAPRISGTPNDLPDGVQDFFYTLSKVDLLSGYSDIEGDELSITGLTSPNATIILNNDGNFTVVPAAGFFGDLSLTYQITDGLNSTEVSKSINIAKLDLPLEQIAPITIPAILEDTASIILSTQELLAEVVSQGYALEDINLQKVQLINSKGGLVNNFDGTWTYTPASNDDTQATFYLSVEVQSGGTTTLVGGRVLLDITPVDDAPIKTGQQEVLSNGSEDTSYTISTQQLLKGFTDIEGSKLSISGIPTADHAQVTIVNGEYVITPEANYFGPVKLSYLVSDGTNTTLASIDFTINPINDLPEVGSVTLTAVAEDSVEPRIISANEILSHVIDIDSANLNILSLSILSGKGELIANQDGTWSYLPSNNDDTSVVFSVTVSDGDGGVTNTTASMDIIPVNDAPFLAGSQQVLNNGSEDNSYTISAQQLLKGFGDVEGSTLVIAGVPTANHGTVAIIDGSYVVTPDADYNGPITLTYFVSDGTDSTPAEITFSLSAVNDAPVANPVELTPISEDLVQPRIITSSELLANTSDIDSENLVVESLAISSGKGTLVANNDGTWTYTPALNDDSAVVFTLQISDGENSVSTSASLDITPVNDAPKLTGSQTVLSNGSEDTTYLISAQQLLRGFSDVEGSALSLDGLPTADHATVTLVNGNYIITPNENYNGQLVLSYAVTDGTDSTQANITLSLSPVNDAPQGSLSLDNTIYSAAAPNASLVDTTGLLSSTDVDFGDTASYRILGRETKPANITIEGTNYNSQNEGQYGTLYLNTASGEYRFIANQDAISNLGFNTVETFGFRVTDSAGAFSDQSFTVNLLKPSNAIYEVSWQDYSLTSGPIYEDLAFRKGHGYGITLKDVAPENLATIIQDPSVINLTVDLSSDQFVEYYQQLLTLSQAGVIKSQGIELTDNGTPVIHLTAEQIQQGSSAGPLSMIDDQFSVVVADVPFNQLSVVQGAAGLQIGNPNLFKLSFNVVDVPAQNVAGVVANNQVTALSVVDTGSQLSFNSGNSDYINSILNAAKTGRLVEVTSSDGQPILMPVSARNSADGTIELLSKLAPATQLIDAQGNTVDIPATQVYLQAATWWWDGSGTYSRNDAFLLKVVEELNKPQGQLDVSNIVFDYRTISNSFDFYIDPTQLQIFKGIDSADANLLVSNGYSPVRLPLSLETILDPVTQSALKPLFDASLTSVEGRNTYINYEGPRDPLAADDYLDLYQQLLDSSFYKTYSGSTFYNFQNAASITDSAENIGNVIDQLAALRIVHGNSANEVLSPVLYTGISLTKFVNGLQVVDTTHPTLSINAAEAANNDIYNVLRNISPKFLLSIEDSASNLATINIAKFMPPAGSYYNFTVELAPSTITQNIVVSGGKLDSINLSHLVGGETGWKVSSVEQQGNNTVVIVSNGTDNYSITVQNQRADDLLVFRPVDPNVPTDYTLTVADFNSQLMDLLSQYKAGRLDSIDITDLDASRLISMTGDQYMQALGLLKDVLTNQNYKLAVTKVDAYSALEVLADPNLAQAYIADTAANLSFNSSNGTYRDLLLAAAKAGEIASLQATDNQAITIPTYFGNSNNGFIELLSKVADDTQLNLVPWQRNDYWWGTTYNWDFNNPVVKQIIDDLNNNTGSLLLDGSNQGKPILLDKDTFVFDLRTQGTTLDFNIDANQLAVFKALYSAQQSGAIGELLITNGWSNAYLSLNLSQLQNVDNLIAIKPILDATMSSVPGRNPQIIYNGSASVLSVSEYLKLYSDLVDSNFYKTYALTGGISNYQNMARISDTAENLSANLDTLVALRILDNNSQTNPVLANSVGLVRLDANSGQYIADTRYPTVTINAANASNDIAVGILKGIQTKFVVSIQDTADNLASLNIAKLVPPTNSNFNFGLELTPTTLNKDITISGGELASLNLTKLVGGASGWVASNAQQVGNNVVITVTRGSESYKITVLNELVGDLTVFKPVDPNAPQDYVISVEYFNQHLLELAAQAKAGLLNSITLTNEDSSHLLQMSSDQYRLTFGLLDKITDTGYKISLSGVEVFNLVDSLQNPLVASVALQDTAAKLSFNEYNSTYRNTLLAAAKAGKIVSFAASDGKTIEIPSFYGSTSNGMMELLAKASLGTQINIVTWEKYDDWGTRYRWNLDNPLLKNIVDDLNNNTGTLLNPANAGKTPTLPDDVITFDFRTKGIDLNFDINAAQLKVLKGILAAQQAGATDPILVSQGWSSVTLRLSLAEISDPNNLLALKPLLDATMSSDGGRNPQIVFGGSRADVSATNYVKQYQDFVNSEFYKAYANQSGTVNISNFGQALRISDTAANISLLIDQIATLSIINGGDVTKPVNPVTISKINITDNVSLPSVVIDTLEANNSDIINVLKSVQNNFIVTVAGTQAQLSTANLLTNLTPPVGTTYKFTVEIKPTTLTGNWTVNAGKISRLDLSSLEGGLVINTQNSGSNTVITFYKEGITHTITIVGQQKASFGIVVPVVQQEFVLSADDFVYKLPLLDLYQQANQLKKITLSDNIVAQLTVSQFKQYSAVIDKLQFTSGSKLGLLSVTGVSNADIASLGLDSRVAQIGLSSNALTATDYANAKGKIVTDHLTIFSVSAQNAFALATDPRVDFVQLSAGQSISSLAFSNPNLSLVAKIKLADGRPLEISVTDAPSVADALSIAVLSYISKVTLGVGVSTEATISYQGFADGNSFVIAISKIQTFDPADQLTLHLTNVPADGSIVELLAITDLGVVSIDVIGNALSLTLDQAQSVIDANVDIADNDVITITGITIDLIQSISPETITLLQQLGVRIFAMDQGAIEFTSAEEFIQITSAFELLSSDIVTVFVQPEDGIAVFDALTFGQLTGLAAAKALGLDQINFGLSAKISVVDALAIAASGIQVINNPGLLTTPTPEEAMLLEQAGFSVSTERFDVLGEDAWELLLDPSVTKLTLADGEKLIISYEDFVAHPEAIAKLQNPINEVLQLDSATDSLSISDTEALGLAQAQIEIAAEDEVTVFNDENSDRLKTSLKDLQKLGVDTVLLSGSDSLTVNLGTGEEGLSGSGIPLFGDTNLDGQLSKAEDDALSVTLNLESAQTQIGNVAGLANELSAAGIDYLSINGAAEGSVSITDAQASDLIGAGLVFSDAGGADDQVALNVGAEGTYLSTSLKDLQKLGIDQVLAGSDNLIVVDMGNLLTGDISAINLPEFVATNDFNEDSVIDERDINVLLNLSTDQLEQQLGNVLDIASALRASGVDMIKGDIDANSLSLLGFDSDPNTTDLSALMQTSNNSGLNFNFNVDLQLIDALAASGIANVAIEPNSHVSLSDSLARALVQSGMLSALPETNLVLDATTSGQLIQTSLKDMAQIGVDSINLSSNITGNKFYLNIGDSLSDASAIADLRHLISEIDPSLKPLFTGNSTAGKALVLDGNTALSLTQDGVLDTTLMESLAKIGITEIDVVSSDVSSLNITSSNEQVSIKLIGSGDDEYDYLYNYLHHK